MGYAHIFLIEFQHVQSFLEPGQNKEILYDIHYKFPEKILLASWYFEIVVNFHYLWKQVKQACSKQHATSETKQA